MKMGWIKPKPPTEDEEDDEPKFYNLWENENEVSYCDKSNLFSKVVYN